MEWLTEEQVKAEADKGKLAAMKCSGRHHEQGRDAKREELIAAIDDNQFAVHVSYCACCAKYNMNCKKCVFGHSTGAQNRCCGDNWNTVSDTFDDFAYDYSNANFKAFQEAEAVLCKYIEGKIAEEENKGKGECWSCKYQPFSGDKHPCIGCDKVACNGSNWEAKSKLKKGTPMLTHLDYGVRHDESWVRWNGNTLWTHEGSKDCCITNKQAIKTRLGNLIADLKRNSEDLTEFKMGDSGGDYDFEANLSGPHIRIQCCTRSKTGLYWDIDEVEEIHQKLGQLIATAKRQGSK